MKFRWYLVLVSFVLFPMLLSVPPVSAQDSDTVQELKMSYLKSIYDDCRTFLEGIELFIRRDYPKFWQNIAEGRPIPQDEVDRYAKELKHFEGQLDALYEEYITFKKTSGNTTSNNASFRTLELNIYQMLAYSYLKAGAFAMSYDFLQDKEIFSQNCVIKLTDIEGNMKEFPLTLELKKLFRLVSGNLTFLTIKLKYFFPEDIQSINAYLEIPDYDRESPFNRVYFSYYKASFAGLGEGQDNKIHFSDIIHYSNRQNYINDITSGSVQKQQGKQHNIATISFPIIKGEYNVGLKDNTIMATVSSDNSTIYLERLCAFKGYVVTDFRRLKNEERQNIKNDTLISKGLTLEKTDLLHSSDDIMSTTQKDTKKRILLDYELSKDDLKNGENLRYDVYRLFEQGKYLGMIELVPCYKGEECQKISTDKSITKVKVYNHELTFYQDILDAVQANRRMYSKGNLGNEPRRDASAISSNVASSEKASSEPAADTSKVHVGRGCSSRR